MTGYNWKRFWCEEGSTFHLDDGGYLYDPDSEFGKYVNRGLLSTESLKDTSCLVLLGEPGIGKSFEIDKLWRASREQAQNDGNPSLSFNLRDYDSNAFLDEKVFQNDDVRSWLQSGNTIYLFLDSLDEALLSIKPLASFLADKIRELPVDRLKLRIACRTAAWQNLQILKDTLSSLYKRKPDETIGFRALELLPLRKKDVLEAVQNKGLDEEAFVQDIESKEVVPLAIKPVTLNFLISSYQKNGSLAASQKELYLEGCRLLCEEKNLSRKASQRKGRLSVEQRFRIAGLMAALSIFTNKFAFSLSANGNSHSCTNLSIQDICRAKIKIDSQIFDVNEDLVRETLDTGLFSSLGKERMGWAHQTYAEFLAAYFVVSNEIKLKQIKSLVFHAGDPEGKIVPQLKETVAWLTGMLPELFREITQIEPELLLLSDVATVDPEDRERLVGALLTFFDEEKLLQLDYDVRRRYSKLAHPKIGQQLRPYITDLSLKDLVRREAIQIVALCKVDVLNQELLDIVIDSDQKLEIRVVAASALVDVADTVTKEKLKPLAIQGCREDEDYDLKGYCLMVVWPDNLSARELFGALPPLKKEISFGSYRRFLTDYLVEELNPTDLSFALDWIRQLPFSSRVAISMGDVFENILFKSWKHLESPSVVHAFAETLIFIARTFHHFSYDKLGSKLIKEIVTNREKRHSLLQSIVNYIENEDDIWNLSRYEFHLLLSEDFNWFARQLISATLESERTVYSHFMVETFDRRRRQHIWTFLISCRDSQIIRESFPVIVLFGGLIYPDFFRIYFWIKSKPWTYRKRRLRRGKKKKYPVQKYIRKYLSRFERGDLDAWCHLNKVIGVTNSNGLLIGNEYESDLTKFDGWTKAADHVRQCIINAAKTYLLQKDPETIVHLRNESTHRPSMAGYRALRLLSANDPNFIETLSAEIWSRWAAAIYSYIEIGEHAKKIQKKFIKRAYEKAPQQIIDALPVLIDIEDTKGHIVAVDKIEMCLDNRLSEAILEKAKDTKLSPRTFEILLKTLMTRDFQAATEYAKSIIERRNSNSLKKDRPVIAACSLVLYTNDASWSTIWPAMRQDVNFGRLVIESLADFTDRYSNDIASKLSEAELGQFYIWVAKQYPPTEDPVHEGAYTQSRRDLVADFRGMLINHLVNRGTIEACSAIMTIIEEFPDEKRFKDVLIRTQANTRRQTWSPPKPKEFIDLVARQEKRFVQNGSQLLEVILESFQEYQDELKGELPSVSALWNEDHRKKRFKPKEENDFSDHVAGFLRREISQRGIVVNREVRIRRSQLTDIHVDAITEDENVFKSLKVIIEVKGCWHDELWTAMETQLVNRYLKDHECQWGIYLVGWFASDSWDGYKRYNRKKVTIDKARTILTKQARTLSNDKEIRAVVLDTSRD